MKMEEYRKIWIKAGLSREMFHGLARTFDTLKDFESQLINPSEYYTRTYMAKGVLFSMLPSRLIDVLLTSVTQVTSLPTPRSKLNKEINQILQQEYSFYENSSLPVTVGSPRTLIEALVIPFGKFQVMQSKRGKALSDLYKIQKKVTLTDEQQKEAIEMALSDFEIVTPNKVQKGRRIILIGPRNFYMVGGR